MFVSAPTASSVFSLIVEVTEPSPNAKVPSPGFNSPSSLPGPAPSTMTTSVGSSSKEPIAPFAALVSTLPLNSNVPFPEVSTKPPSPPSAPPFAEINPLNRVTSSAHTITRPPSPESIASTRIDALSAT